MKNRIAQANRTGNKNTNATAQDQDNNDSDMEQNDKIDSGDTHGTGGAMNPT